MEKIRQREQEGRSSPLGKTHQKFYSMYNLEIFVSTYFIFQFFRNEGNSVENLGELISR